MRKEPVLLVLLALINTIMAESCATLTRGGTQNVPVTSSPIGAAVSVNGERQGVTPLEVFLARKPKNQVIRIESAGYNPVEIRIRRKMSTYSILSNFLLGVVPGFGVGVGGALLYASTVEPSDEDLWNGLPISWLIGALAFGGIFTAIDAGTGKGFELTPKELEVTLTKTDGVPRVDTIDVDANDIQNVKWIRVHRR